MPGSGTLHSRIRKSVKRKMGQVFAWVMQALVLLLKGSRLTHGYWGVTWSAAQLGREITEMRVKADYVNLVYMFPPKMSVFSLMGTLKAAVCGRPSRSLQAPWHHWTGVCESLGFRRDFNRPRTVLVFVAKGVCGPGVTGTSRRCLRQPSVVFLKFIVY